MSVRAKFKLESITSHAYGDTKTVKFIAQYDTSIPEDQRFQKATPWGEFQMMIDNPVALEQLKLGEHYYFDITPA